MDQFIIQSTASSYMWGFPASLWESLGFGWLVGQNKQHVDINLGSEEHFSTFYFHFTDNYSIKLEDNLDCFSLKYRLKMQVHVCSKYIASGKVRFYRPPASEDEICRSMFAAVKDSVWTDITDYIRKIRSWTVGRFFSPEWSRQKQIAVRV